MIELAVISGKGGTGKSSITASLATMNNRVVLADCDVDAANMHIIMEPQIERSDVYLSGEKAVIDADICTGCRLCEEFCRFDAISFNGDVCEVDDIACDGCKLCYRICPHKAIAMHPEDKSRMHTGSFRNGRMVFGQLEPGEENSGKLVAMVRERSREVAIESGIDIILVDAPAGIGCAVIASLSGATHVLIVTEPSLSAFSDLERTLELIDGYKFKRGVIINKYDLSLQITSQIEELCMARGIGILGKLPFDKEVVEAMLNRKSIVEYNPDSKIGKEIKQIWSKFVSNK